MTTNNEMQVVVRLRDELTKGLERAGKGLRDFGRGLSEFGQSTALATAPLAAFAGFSVKAAADFESSFAGVRKTVNATEEEFQRLAQGFRRMALEIPVSVDQLNAIGEAAGQLGIQTSNIMEFTRTVADLTVTTNLNADEASTSLARLANITGLDQSQMGRLGSAIVALGNSLATTEREIVDFGLRLAGAGRVAGLTDAEILALGASLSSVGVNAEAGGTAMQKTLIDMTQAVAVGGEKLELFARTAGLSASEFARLFQEDASEAFTRFVEGLGRAGDKAFNILDELGLHDARLVQSFIALGNAGDLLRRSIELGNDAFQENTALSREAQERYKTFASQTQLLMSSLRELQIEVGNALIPALRDLIEDVRPILEGFAKWARENSGLVRSLAVVTAAIAGLATVSVVVGTVLTPLGAAISGVSAAATLLSKVNWAGIAAGIGSVGAAALVAAGRFAAMAAVGVAAGAAIKVFDAAILGGLDAAASSGMLHPETVELLREKGPAAFFQAVGMETKAVMRDTMTAIGEFGADVIDPFGGKADEIAKNTVEATRKVRDALTEGQAILSGSGDLSGVSLPALGEGLPETFRGLAGGLERVADAVTELDLATEETMPTLREFLTGPEGLNQNILLASRRMSVFSKEAVLARQAFDVLMGRRGPWSAELLSMFRDKAVEASGALGQAFQTVRDMAEKAGNAMADAVKRQAEALQRLREEQQKHRDMLVRFGFHTARNGRIFDPSMVPPGWSFVPGIGLVPFDPVTGQWRDEGGWQRATSGGSVIQQTSVTMTVDGEVLGQASGRHVVRYSRRNII